MKPGHESDIASTKFSPLVAVAGVIADSAGNLYGASPNGGITKGTGSCNPNVAWFGCGVVFKLTQHADGTWAVTVLHQFSGPDGVNPIGVLALDGSGALYGTTLLGGGHGVGAVFQTHTRSQRKLEVHAALGAGPAFNSPIGRSDS